MGSWHDGFFSKGQILYPSTLHGLMRFPLALINAILATYEP